MVTNGRGLHITLVVYGYLPGLTRADLVYATGHDELLPPVPLSFCVIQTTDRVILFDAGASPDWAERKGVVGYRSSGELLPRLGLVDEDVTDVVLSHLHWDHATATPAFDHAQIWVQRAEMEGWLQATAGSVDMRWVHEGRVEPELVDALQQMRGIVLYEGDRQIAEGVWARLADGHSFGTQFLEVETHDGPVVLASDVVFTYENLERMIPLGNGLDQIAMLRSISRAKECAVGGTLVPGHDLRTLEALESMDECTFRVC